MKQIAILGFKSLSLFLAVAGALTGAAAEELVVSSDMTLSADTTCSSIRFTGGYSLSAADGVKVTVEAGGGITVASGAATVNCLVQFGSTTDGATIDASEAPIVVPSGATLTFSSTACLSGDAKIVFGYPGTVNMYATNTFNGTLLVSNGLFNVYSDGAFGTKIGKTIYDCRLYNISTPQGKIRMSFYGVKMEDDFEVHPADVYGSAHFYTYGNVKTNFFNGKVTTDSNNRWNIKSGATLVEGGTEGNYYKGYNIYDFDDSTTCRYVINAPTYIGIWNVQKGQIEVNAPIRTPSSDGFRIRSSSTVKTGMADVLSLEGYRTHLQFRDNGGTFDLNGYDQVVNYIREEVVSSEAIITSSKSATLRVLGVKGSSKNLNTVTYSGKFTGAVNLQVEGGKPQQLAGDSTTTGSLCVTNGGQLAFAATAVWEGTSVRVTGEGSWLSVTNCTALSDAVQVTVDDSGELNLPTAGDYSFAKLTINGTALDEGTYPSGSAAFEGLVTGAGNVIVQPKIVVTDWTWNGAKDDNLYDAGNWEGSVAPDFTDLSAHATFATGGTRAAFSGSPAFNEITFNAANGFTLATNAPNASLSIYGNGITVAEGTADRTYRIDSPVTLLRPQEWTVGTKGDLILSGPLAASTTYNVFKKGAGTLHLTNPDSTLSCNLTHEKGTLYLVGGALGDTESKLTVKSGAIIHYAGGTFSEDTVWENMNSMNPYCLHYDAATTNVITRSIDCSGANVRPQVARNCQITYRQAIKNAQYWLMGLSAGCEVVFEKACYLGNFHATCWDKPRATVRLRDTGFTMSTSYNALTEWVTLVCEADWAYHANTNKEWRPLMMRGGAIFDLNGHNQGIGGFARALGTDAAYKSDENGAITSATPATLYDYQKYGLSTNDYYRTSATDDPPFVTKFTGQVSLSKGGPAYLYLSGVSTTTGRLEVTEGTLGFKESGSWLNASEIDVLGGTLIVDQVGRLPKKVQTIKIGKNATLSLATGVSIRCRELYVQNSDDSWTKTTGSFKTGDLGGRVTGGGTLTASAGVAVILR